MREKTPTKERIIKPIAGRDVPPDIVFEDTSVGKLEKELWEASDREIDIMLAKYGVPWSSELVKPGSYIQTTPAHIVEANRAKNDVVLIPVGSTEYHGQAMPSAADTLFVTQLCEGVRRYTARRQGRPVALAWPITYGAHPWHHYGMPGNVIIEEDHLKQHVLDMMLGLWNYGFRKQIFVNNHGHFWVFESVIQEFMKKYQLPGVYRVLDWHRCVRKFFRAKERGGDWETDFVHADEAEHSLALLLVPEMVDMEYAVDTDPWGYLPDGHMDKAVDGLIRPSKWSDSQGHAPIEIVQTPEGVVGKATLADAQKAKRPVAAFLRYLTLLIDEILERFPPGKVPPTHGVTFRTKKEMAAALRTPGSPDWKPVYALNKK